MSDLEPTSSPLATTAEKTWRAPLNWPEYVVLRVQDLDAAVDWYGKALDLKLIRRDEGSALLGCGGDERADLVLREGGVGIEGYAFGVDGIDEAEQVERRFAEKGIATTWIESEVPDVAATLEVDSPTGVKLRFVVGESGPTGHPADTRTDGVAPLDLDHVTLLASDVRGYADWLGRTLGFAVSDAFRLPEGADGWLVAWTHITSRHHDLALIASPGDQATLHHVAFMAEDLNHMGEIAERVCSLSEQDRCEWGPGKHGGLGANYYLYFKDPSGNRIEICSNMDDHPFDEETVLYDASEFGDFASVWNYLPPPPDFSEGT